MRKQTLWYSLPITAIAMVSLQLGTPTPRRDIIASADTVTAEMERRVFESSGRVIQKVSERVSPAVVYIEAAKRDENKRVVAEESGSGVIVRPAGSSRPVIITNMHVVQESKENDIEIYLSDGQVFRPSKMWLDSDTDIALLESPVSDLPAVTLANSDSVYIGQWVLAIGSPFGLSQSVTHGIISAKGRRHLGVPGDMRIKEFLQTDAAINPGSSGGPLVNLEGEIIGINTAIATRTGSSSGVGFSIPSNLVRWVAEEMLVHGNVRRGFLGVQFPSDYGFAKARRLGLPSPRGALIGHVHDGSPAYLAGLRPDDVILEFHGTSIEDENHLINVVSQTPIGQSVSIVVWRERKKQSLNATLSSWDRFQQDKK